MSNFCDEGEKMLLKEDGSITKYSVTLITLAILSEMIALILTQEVQFLSYSLIRTGYPRKRLSWVKKGLLTTCYKIMFT